MFAILRTKRIKNYTQMSNMFKHNLRQKYANNVDSDKSKNNTVYIDKIMSSSEMQSFYDSMGVEEKANSTKAIELVLTASPEFFQMATKETIEKWKKAQIDFLQKEYGKKLKFLVCHEDETSPHFHAVISVEETKTHKYKNQKGEFFKEKTTLNSRHFNRQYLIDLQTRYAKANNRYGLSRGMYNSRARHKELKAFQADVNKSLNSDYSKGLEQAFDKALKAKSKLGFIRYDDAKAFFLHTSNALTRKNKNLKTAVKSSKDYYDIAQQSLKDSEKAKQEIEKRKMDDNLRQEYFNSVKDYKGIKEENKTLQKDNEKLKEEVAELKWQAQNKNSVKIDNRYKKS